MTSDAPRRAALAGLVLLGVVAAAPLRAAEPARGAEAAYPFEGTWVRANRVCTASAPRVRTYTAHEVTSPSGRCAYRKVASGGGQFEIFEDCRHAERPGNYTETIRMLGPDLLQMRRQAARLKIARPLRYMRCTAAAPAPGGAPKVVPAAAPHHPAEPRAGEEHAPRPAEARPAEARPPETLPTETKAVEPAP